MSERDDRYHATEAYRERNRERMRRARLAQTKGRRRAVPRSHPDRWDERTALTRSQGRDIMPEHAWRPTHGGSRAGVFVQGVTPEFLRGRCIAADPVKWAPRWARIENAPPQWRLLITEV